MKPKLTKFIPSELINWINHFSNQQVVAKNLSYQIAPHQTNPAISDSIFMILIIYLEYKNLENQSQYQT